MEKEIGYFDYCLYGLRVYLAFLRYCASASGHIGRLWYLLAWLIVLATGLAGLFLSVVIINLFASPEPEGGAFDIAVMFPLILFFCWTFWCQVCLIAKRARDYVGKDGSVAFWVICSFLPIISFCASLILLFRVGRVGLDFSYDGPRPN